MKLLRIVIQFNIEATVAENCKNIQIQKFRLISFSV
jgi:hypothetical protein